MIIAYDAANPVHIPASAAAVLPYSDGRYRWSNARFPHALFRYYTITGLASADIADFEPGCIWPGSALRSWAERRTAAGHPDLTVYVSRDDYPEAVAAMQGFTWHLGLATLDGTKFSSWQGRPVRYCQFTDRVSLDYDMSEVYDVAWLNHP
jgi:hypothetical protein